MPQLRGRQTLKMEFEVRERKLDHTDLHQTIHSFSVTSVPGTVLGGKLLSGEQNKHYPCNMEFGGKERHLSREHINQLMN